MKFLLITLSLFISSQAFSAELKKINSYTKDESFYTELTFDEAVSSDQVSLDFINETVQVNLSKASLGKSISTKVEDEKVRTIYTYKLADGTIRSRIIYKDGIKAGDFQDVTVVEAKDNKVIVKIADRQTLPAKVAVSEKISDEDLAQAAQWLQDAEKTENSLAAVKEAEIEASKTKRESEIPILATSKSSASERKEASTSRVMVSLVLVLGLLLGFSVFLRKFMKRTPQKKHSQVKVLAQHYLGPKKSLAIIRVAGESMLIGVTDQNINLIKTLALLDEEIPENTPKDFSQSLDNSMSDGPQDEEDEFSISKIKDFVSGRLKNMKEI